MDLGFPVVALLPEGFVVPEGLFVADALGLPVWLGVSDVFASPVFEGCWF